MPAKGEIRDPEGRKIVSHTAQNDAKSEKSGDPEGMRGSTEFADRYSPVLANGQLPSESSESRLFTGELTIVFAARDREKARAWIEDIAHDLFNQADVLEIRVDSREGDELEAA